MPAMLWPFIGTEALSTNVISEHTVRTRYEQIYPGVYVPRGREVSARQRAVAAWLWSRRGGVVAGLSAAATLGTKWIDGDLPAELIHGNRRAPSGLHVHTDDLAPSEAVVVGRMHVTCPARTAFDIGRRITNRVQAIKRLDALAHATGVTATDIHAVAAAHPGVRGLLRLRRVVPLMDAGAESPQETDARLALIDAGLPAPSTQVVIRGRYGEFIARVDLAYEGVKLAIEYDGPQHWEDSKVRQRDIDKGVELADLDWGLVRVGSNLLYHRRATYLHRVTTVLRERGMTW